MAILEAIQDICSALEPEMIISISAERFNEIWNLFDVEKIVENATGMAYLSKKLCDYDYFNEKSDLYRVWQCHDGYLISSPFGVGNERPHYFWDSNGKDYIDEALGALLGDANTKHFVAMRTAVHKAGERFLDIMHDNVVKQQKSRRLNGLTS